MRRSASCALPPFGAPHRHVDALGGLHRGGGFLLHLSGRCRVRAGGVGASAATNQRVLVG
jgi:hypothetical protein